MSAKRYTVKSLTAAAGGPAWELADKLNIDCYPWYVGGVKQATTVRLLYDESDLHIRFDCVDSHIFSRETKLNGSVYADSCVEIFAAVDPAASADYFNLEVNCCGVKNMGIGPGRPARRRITPELAARVVVTASEPGPTRQESPRDNGWWVVEKLPLEVLGELAGRRVMPRPGTIWRANFYRCGGKTDQQYACWSPIDSIKHPSPDFHRPEYFGEFVFG